MTPIILNQVIHCDAPPRGLHPPNPAERLPGSQRHPLQRRGTRTPFPPKVLWTVISKTIAWMAALIENNEGHIEHMVAVVSPYPISPKKRKEKKSFSRNLARRKKMQKVCATSQRTFAVNFALVFNEPMPTVRAKGIAAVSGGGGLLRELRKPRDKHR